VTAAADWWAAGQENVYAHRKRLTFIVNAVEAVRTELGKRSGDLSILDVGCGTGIMITLPLASLGYRITGLDIDGESIEAARRVNPYANAAFRQGDVGSPAADERYDVVIASEVLEHVTDPSAFLHALRERLAPGGILLLTTPNGYGWFEWEQFLWEDAGLGERILRWHERWGRFTQRLKAPIKRMIGWQPAPPPAAPPWEYLASTQNTRSPHVQRFRWSRVKRLVAAADLRIVRAGNGSPICGKISHFYLRNCRAFIALNTRIGDLLPRCAVAGWYLACRPATSGKRVLCVADSGLMAQAAAQIEGRFGAPPTLLVSFRQLRQQPGLALRLLLRRFDIAAAVLTDIEAPLYRDFILGYLFLLRAGRKALCDCQGHEVGVGLRGGLQALARCLVDLVGFPVVYGAGCWKAHRLMRGRRTPSPARPASGRVAYLRANLWQESKAGGSVAHATGVLLGLRAAGMDVTYVGTADFPPARRLGAEVSIVHPRLRWTRNFPDLPFLAYSDSFARHCGRLFRDRPPDFVYQRYSVFNSAGAWTARRLGCPFVLEYNGPEVWVARHWGTRLFFEQLGDRVERANLVSADLVVVVSDALRDEVTVRGVPADRVLVNPNAVDPARYHPGIDGGPVRKRLGLEGRLVIGFIGTFGLWHGAEVLARAVRPVAEAIPQAHVLFVGDGGTMPRVREIVAGDGVGDRVTFTGLVAQDEAAGYLAACDLLVSPHVGNPDGSRFFGSPTKLFEYMAMGKGIVASDLDQIGTILAHGKTAWLVPPGDPDALAEALLRLARDPELRRTLGEAAREEVVRRHTWTAHVERILAKLVERGLLPERGRGSHAA
jgi:ubiquinone biosynthesis O-methyltransferase